MNDRTCNRCNQPLTRGQTKFCSHACANKFNMGLKATANRLVGIKTCEVTGCAKPARSRTATMCPMHYHRMYRNGILARKTLDPKWVDLRGHRFGTLTVSERHGQQWVCRCDCGKNRTVSTGELNRTGDGNTCGTPGTHLQDGVGYSAAHERVRRLRGSASLHRCVDCGRPAKHWSYTHTDPAPQYAYGLSAEPLAYSLNTDCYEARCVACHKTFDLSHLSR